MFETATIKTTLIERLSHPITGEQQREFDELVGSAISQIQADQFLPHSGIRFPMNGCTSCLHLGLCLGNQSLVDSKLIRQPGASELDWLDELEN